MIGLTPAAAGEFKCPIARTFSEKHGHGCDGDGCILWRWIPLPADVMKRAVTAEMKRLSDKSGKAPMSHHKEAVASVTSNPEAHNVNLNPTHGYCGLAGTPEV